MSIYEIEVLTVSGDLTTLEDYKGAITTHRKYGKWLRSSSTV